MVLGKENEKYLVECIPRGKMCRTIFSPATILSFLVHHHHYHRWCCCRFLLLFFVVVAVVIIVVIIIYCCCWRKFLLISFSNALKWCSLRRIVLVFALLYVYMSLCLWFFVRVYFFRFILFSLSFSLLLVILLRIKIISRGKMCEWIENTKASERETRGKEAKENRTIWWAAGIMRFWP